VYVDLNSNYEEIEVEGNNSKVNNAVTKLYTFLTDYALQGDSLILPYRLTLYLDINDQDTRIVVIDNAEN
jgi:hypothetical protein